MKTKIYILVLVFLALMGILNAQTAASKTGSLNLQPFNQSFWNAYADKLQLNAADKKEFISSHQKNHLTFIRQQQGSPSPIRNQGRLSSQNSVMTGGCINIDFENGNLNNWVATNGYNPLYAANPSGCCLSPGGQQTIMSGTGLDPAGGFPVVCPGGNYSLLLGSSQTGGLADRVEQTFLVTAANANFTYKYAVVLQDPGHTVSQQPYFQIEMMDSTGAQVPCTFYSVSAGGGIPGFQSSTTMASVVYKPWSSVVADLTSLIGQNVTIRFTTYDCSLGGHFGYAYIDGSCLAFLKTSNDTICAGSQKTYCAPNGFLSTTWNGPGIVNNTSQCINVSGPGVYTCQTVLIPGCPGPTFTYTLSNFPKPGLAFNPVSTSACSQQFTFSNTSSITSGAITSYSWNFGNTTSNLTSPAHNYTATGNYSISLTGISDKGCTDSIRQTISIYPFPVVSFTAPASCLGNNVLFTDASSVSAGSISSYTWNFGNGSSSNISNPTMTYTGSGNYLVSLSVSSNQKCVSTQTASLTIYPKPQASFNDTFLSSCSTQYSFANTSMISSGSIASYSWTFGNAVSSLQQSPVYSFPSTGNYTVALIAISNKACRDTAFKTVSIYPFPSVSFTAPSSCLNDPVNFSGASSVSLGSISSYTWDFGNGQISIVANPSLTYTNSGTYLISLSATSNQNCITTTTGNVVIYPMPNASVSIAGFCYGSSTSFSNNSSIAGGTLTSFGWDFGDGNSAFTAGGNHLYASTGSYNISFSVTSGQNCMSTATRTVVIDPLPFLSYTATNVCYGNNTYFANTSSIASGSINIYAWSFGNGNGSGLVSPSLIYSTSGNYVVTLSATSDRNCVASVTNTVVIHPIPVLSFSASNICFGDTTVFINTNSISSGTTASFEWTFGDGNSSVLQNPVHNYSGYGSYVVSLSATSDQNCTASYTNVLNIYPLPVISFSASDVCLGNNTYFLNGSSIPSGNISSWNWSFGNGQATSPQLMPNYLYAAAGAYSVSLQATSTMNCRSSFTKVVQVFANPTASFVTKNSCLGETSVFTNASSATSPDQIISYSWDFGNGNTSSLINPMLTYTTGAIYPVKLTVTTNNNCSRTYISPLTIYHLPQVNFSPSFACKNQATQFVNSSTLLSGTMSKCRWDFENDGIWDDTVNVNPVKTYPTHGVYSCRLEVISSFQCPGDKTNNVTVYANPVAEFIVRPVCLGNLTTFSNQSTSIDGIITSYQWDFNGDNIIDNISPSPTITYSANGTYLVRLEVQTQYGCTNVKSTSGHINAMPLPNFSATNNKGCPGLPVNFENASSIGTGSIVTTQWLFGDGSLPDYSQNPTHMYAPGSYNVTLKLVSDSGCIATFYNPGFVTIYPKPVAGFNVEPEEVDENDPVINVKSTATNATVTRYYLNDGSDFGTDKFSHTFQNIDQVKPVVVQIVLNEFNCPDTLIEVLKVNPSFVIYIPNTFTPNGDGLNDGFQAKGVGISKFSIQIYDRWGHLLYETNDIENAWDGTVRGSTEPIKQDTYAWKAKVVDIFNKTHDLSGHVSLIR